MWLSAPRALQCKRKYHCMEFNGNPSSVSSCKDLSFLISGFKFHVSGFSPYAYPVILNVGIAPKLSS
jgi:hypothetical protein